MVHRVFRRQVNPFTRAPARLRIECFESHFPSEEPTTTPSEEPSEEPSEAPTHGPTAEPSLEPTSLSVVHPPPTRQPGQPAGDISPEVMACCRMLGIETLYRIGGAQAVAALALGTERVQPVDLVAGPGNVFVQLGD